jgi:hypothetical protein
MEKEVFRSKGTGTTRLQGQGALPVASKWRALHAEPNKTAHLGNHTFALFCLLEMISNPEQTTTLNKANTATPFLDMVYMC